MMRVVNCMLTVVWVCKRTKCSMKEGLVEVVEDSVGSLQLVVVVREGRTDEGEGKGQALYSTPRPCVLHFCLQLGLTPPSSTSLIIVTFVSLVNPDRGGGPRAVRLSASVMEPVHSAGKRGAPS